MLVIAFAAGPPPRAATTCPFAPPVSAASTLIVRLEISGAPVAPTEGGVGGANAPDAVAVTAAAIDLADAPLAGLEAEGPPAGLGPVVGAAGEPEAGSSGRSSFLAGAASSREDEPFGFVDEPRGAPSASVGPNPAAMLAEALDPAVVAAAKPLATSALTWDINVSIGIP